MKFGFTQLVVPAVIGCLIFAGARAHADFFNGFETDNSGWNVFGGASDATRVPSGTDGITSEAGGFHGKAISDPMGGSAATNWGGYSSVFQPYTTSIDVYLDMSGTNDTRFDWSSAINKTNGAHLRDFAFNAGFYTDNTGPGAGGARFIFSASNNTGRANAYPKNPGRDPFAVMSSGWYTLSHSFYDDGGVLAVDMSIAPAGGSVLHSWTLSNPSDLIPSVVGGNRYGWFAANEFNFLAIDNSRLEINAIPEPAFFQMGALIGMSGLGLLKLRKRSA